MCIKVASKGEPAPLLAGGKFFIQYLFHPQSFKVDGYALSGDSREAAGGDLEMEKEDEVKLFPYFCTQIILYWKKESF